MDFSSEMILHDDTGMRTTLLPRAVDCYGNMATEIAAVYDESSANCKSFYK